jgi:hypothetical protein
MAGLLGQKNKTTTQYSGGLLGKKKSVSDFYEDDIRVNNANMERSKKQTKESIARGKQLETPKKYLREGEYIDKNGLIVPNLPEGELGEFMKQTKAENDFQNKSTLEKIITAVSEMPKKLLEKKSRKEISKAINEAVYGKEGTTPIDQRITLKTNNKTLGNFSLGENIVPAYKEDTALNKVRKGLANIVGGTALKTIGAPVQALMQTTVNTANIAQGKPLDFSEKSLKKDILPKEYSQLIDTLSSKGNAGKLLSGFIQGAVEGTLDPANWIGGTGVLDDMIKAGIVGKSATRGTVENLISSAKKNQDALKSVLKKIETKEVLTEVEKQAVEELPEKIKTEIYKALPSGERLLLPEKATSSLEAPSIPLTQYERKTLKNLDSTLNKAYNKSGGVDYGRNQIAGKPIEVRGNIDTGLETGRVYRRADSRSPVLVRIGNSDVAAYKYTPSENIKKILEGKNKNLTDMYGISDSNAFFDAINTAKKEIPHGPYVTAHTPNEYLQMKTFLTSDGHAGVAVTKDGDIVSVFNNSSKSKIKGGATQLLVTALENGGKKLDNFDGTLSRIYEQHGFVPVAKTKFNKEFAPPDWKPEFGEPDIMFYVHNGDTTTKIANKVGEYELFPKDKVPMFNTYDEAAAYRDKVLAQQESKYAKLVTLQEKQRQSVASMTGSKVLPEQPKPLQVPEQFKREMPRRTTTSEIEQVSKSVVPEIKKLRTPTKTVETLKPVDNIQTATPKTTAVNGAQKLKTSQFRTNTLERATNIPESVKKKLNPDEFDYIPETSEEWQQKAVQNVSENRQKVINDIKSAETISGGVQAHEASIIANDLVEQSKKTGNVDELLSFTQDVAAKTREWARGLKGTDTAYDKLSPAGTLIKAQREIINSVPDEIKNAVKTEIKETKPVLDEINKINKENIDQVFKDLIGEKPKASKAVREWLEKQETEAMTRVKEYFKPDTSGIIKLRAGIPGEILTDLAKVGAAKLARKAMDFAEWSVEMIKEFGERVKPYLKQIFDESDKLIKSRFLKTPEQKTAMSIDKVVKKALSDNGIKIQDIAKKHVSEIDDTGKTLAQKLTEQANLSPETASKVEKLFSERLKVLTTTKKQQILDQMFKPKRTYQRKSLGDKIIEFSNMGAIGDQKYAKILNEKYKIPELDAETAKSIIKQSEHIQTIDNVFERQKLVNKMLNDVQKKIPASFAAKAKSFTMINTLLNPKTIGSRNILGNITQMAAMRANKAIMSAIDFTTSKLTGKDRTITFKTGRGIENVIKDFFADVKTGAKSGWEGYTPYGTVSEFKMASQAFQGKYNPLTYMEKALGAALSGAGDYPFYMKAVMDSIGEQSVLKAMNQGLKGPALKDAAKKYADEIINSAKNISDFSSKVLDIANRAGEKATFRDANIISNILQGVHDTFNIAGFGKTKATIGKMPSREFGLGDVIIMFARTPGALLNIGLEYSPLGAAKSLYYIGEGIFKHAKGTGGVNREKLIESLTKAIGGTLLLSGTGYYLASKGAVTGKAPKDKEARNFFDENGQKAYSFNADAIIRWFKNGFDDNQLKPQKGDKWYTYDWLAPFSFNVGLGANAAQEGIKLNTLQALPDTVAASVQMFAENDTVSKLINVQVNKDITERLIDTAVAIPSRFVPMGSILNQIRQMTDNTKRDVSSDDWKVKTMNLLKNRLPGLSKTLPEVINQDGTVKEMYAGGSNNPLNVFLSPGYLGIYETSPGRQLLIDLYKSTGKTSQFPKTATNNIKVYNQDVKLTSEEKAKLQKYVGRITWQTLDNLPDQKEFTDLSDEKKLRVISNLLEEIGNMGEEYVAEFKGIKKPTKSEERKRLKENAVPKLKVFK